MTWMMGFGCVVWGWGAYVFSMGCGWDRKLVLHWVEFLKKMKFNYPINY
jgi:hypothetical protein